MTKKLLSAVNFDEQIEEINETEKYIASIRNTEYNVVLAFDDRSEFFDCRVFNHR